MADFGMGSKVWIKSINSIDKIPQQGTVIGIIKVPDAHYLSHFTFNSYLRSLTGKEYVVAYERMDRVCTEKYQSSQLEKWSNRPCTK